MTFQIPIVKDWAAIFMDLPNSEHSILSRNNQHKHLIFLHIAIFF